MDMVWHQHPRPQFVTANCELTKVILNDLRYGNPAQATLPATFVQIRLHFCAPLAIIFNLRKMIPLRTKRLGKTVSQMKRDELREPRLIAMRQITSLIPATKSPLGILRFRRGRPP